MGKTIRRIILKQGQSPGDILTFTRPAYDLKRAYPEIELDIHVPSGCGALFENNPYTTPMKEDDPGVEVYAIEYNEINISGWNGLHFSTAFRHDIEQKINTPEMVEKWGKWEIPSTGILPELFISDEEKTWYHQLHCTFYWDGPFWILNAGMKSDNVLKQYHRWQAVIDLLNDYWQGKVRIVQIGARSSSGLAHHHPELTGVFNLVGQTDTRQLIRLAYHSEGSIGPISLQFVLIAAFEKPGVIAAGGKEGTRWHIYNHVQWVKKNGCLPCAMSDGCWLGGKMGQCKNLVKPPDMDDLVPLCFEMTTPQELADRVIDYYIGGMLQIPDKELWFENGKERFEKCYHSGKFPEPDVEDKPTWIFIKEAGALASVSEGTIIRWIKSGKVVGKKEKGRWLVDSKTL
jgi:hypothetical protein